MIQQFARSKERLTERARRLRRRQTFKVLTVQPARDRVAIQDPNPAGQPLNKSQDASKPSNAVTLTPGELKAVESLRRFIKCMRFRTIPEGPYLNQPWPSNVWPLELLPDSEHFQGKSISETIQDLVEHIAKLVYEITCCCSICFEQTNWSRRPDLSLIVHRVTPECSHYYDVCKDCLQASIASQMDSNFIDQLKCPICPQKLNHETMKQHASKQVFER